MIKFTNLAGKEFYVRQNAINMVREPFEDEYKEPAGAVIVIGSQALAVRETVPQVTSRLGMAIG